MTTRLRFPPVKHVDDFWAWFAGIAPTLAQNFEDDTLLEELDSWVSRLGPISWEIGPGREKPNALALSPEGDLDALRLTRWILTHAPVLEDWELHPAKPPKQWDLRFSVQADGGKEVAIDARDWRYVLHRFPDQTFDISIIAPSLSSVEEALRGIAARIVLDGVLGEARRVESIGGIEVLVQASEELLARSGAIAVLSEHIGRLRTAK